MIFRPNSWVIPCAIILSVFSGCRISQVSPMLQQPPTLAGAVTYEDGTPAAGALIAITNLDTGRQIDVIDTDDKGHFQHVLAAGSYALAITAPHGFAWVEKQLVPNITQDIKLSRTCHIVTGTTTSHAFPTRINLTRKSTFTGDTFVASVQRDGRFALCLPEAHYNTFLTGETVSLMIDVTIPFDGDIHIQGFASNEVRHGLQISDRLTSNLEGLIEDIVRRNPVLIGLGEATHGTSEFFSTRGQLTLALMKRGDVRLILLEVDAIGAAALDDYVNGITIDIAKAVAALGFWVTDTYEFLRFLDAIRAYNTTAIEKVHIWGIDQQNTVLPVQVLLTNAATLSLSASEQTMLRIASEKRGKPVRDLPIADRSLLDALLSRLSTPVSGNRQDLLISIAARSLATQLDYWNGDMRGQYRIRRDAGMVNMTRFLLAQLGSKRACLWAHAGHIAKEGNQAMLGYLLTSYPSLRYYGIGFYMYQGAARAWGATAKTGVISHTIPPAQPYTVENVVMSASGMPEIAWVPLRGVNASFLKWLETPRFVRELGAQYIDDNDLMTLRNVLEAFDAIVVIRAGHDSSPTLTGVRSPTSE